MCLPTIPWVRQNPKALPLHRYLNIRHIFLLELINSTFVEIYKFNMICLEGKIVSAIFFSFLQFKFLVQYLKNNFFLHFFTDANEFKTHKTFIFCK